MRIDKILIANRGEIACRLIRTAKRLGIATVAVYSSADAHARHVDLADEAYCIGPAEAKKSYLNSERILQVARDSGATAVHPGYGFLAENARFATDCAAAGLIFVGPPVQAIEAMGSKSAAKQIMNAAGIPLVPGYHELDQSLQRLQLAAESIGYPLLIKASAGGGGKGMRVVNAAAEFDAALQGAKRESAAAFGDDRVLLEKYIQRPRHVEIQVFADTHNNIVHLFERDCSIQRRHQKVIEEAPAPGLGAETREKMGATAIAAARAIGYVGAGTVEFLLDRDGSFYFMEMNTRLQVEHPVTEMITGQDLVEWQLRVAAGEPLPCQQEELFITGHAIEARLYAEDPLKNFLPSIGPLRHLRLPQESPHVRVDSGVRQGDEVSIHYDPMLAKLIVWDHDRNLAIKRMQQALADFQVSGVTTNIGFLSQVITHRAFAAAELDTSFIEHHGADLFPEPGAASDRILALASLDLLLRRNAEAAATAAISTDPYSPWHCTDGWRLNSDNHHVLNFIDGLHRIAVTVHYRDNHYVLELPGGRLSASGTLDAAGDLSADLDGVRCRSTIVRREEQITVISGGHSHVLLLDDPGLQAGELDGGEGRLTAPMPGKIVAVLVNVGDQVKRGTALVVMEAMKMEHTIMAPLDGIVANLPFRVGDIVDEGVELLGFEPVEETV